MKTNYDVLIIGGGAAGFFAAINIKEKHPAMEIAILEKSNDVLQKVRISGGGRCNITHAESDKGLFLKNYPRGEKELRNVFYKFDNQSIIDWFAQKGVPTKTEKDGRVFPASNTSQSIIDCFLNEVQQLNIPIILQQNVVGFKHSENFWSLETSELTFTAQKLVITTGSNSKIWSLLQELGHNIIPPVPSLFTFNIHNQAIHDLMGVSCYVRLQLSQHKLVVEGNLLFTHWGFSGPAVLKLSAFGARILAEQQYRFQLIVNWIPQQTEEKTKIILQDFKQQHAKKNVASLPPFEFTKRLWDFLLLQSAIPLHLNWADVSKKQMHALQQIFLQNTFEVVGKSTFKDEFVTAGGVSLKEVDFKTMQSKLFTNLFFAGEVLDIDAVTGGFNFQNAWSTAWVVSENI